MGRRYNTGRAKFLLIAPFFFLLILFMPLTSEAQTYRYWIGGNGNWSDEHWTQTYQGATGTTMPVAGEYARVWRDDASGSKQYLLYNGSYYDPTSRLGTLTIVNTRAKGTEASAPPWMYVQQTGGALYMGTTGGPGLTIGPRGAYQLDEGVLDIVGFTNIAGYNNGGGEGFEGGIFYQGFTVGSTGGSVRADSLTLGWIPPVPLPDGSTYQEGPGYGEYKLVNGSLNVTGDTRIGAGGTGSFSQGVAIYNGGMSKVTGNGGTVETANLYLGEARSVGEAVSRGNGTYNLLSGATSASNPALKVTGNAYVGNNGTGTFNQGHTFWGGGAALTGNGGYVKITNNLYIGKGSLPGTTNSSYNLSGGSLEVTGNTYVGYSGTGAGAFNQGGYRDNGTFTSAPGGTVTTANLYVGGSPDGTSSTGTYNLYNGTLSVAGNTYLGYNGVGRLNMGQPQYNAGAGSWVYSTATESNPIRHQTTNLYIRGGNDPQSSSAYNLYAGALAVSGNTYVGYASSGTAGNFTQGGVLAFWSGSPPNQTLVSTSNMTDGGTFTTGNLFLGGAPAVGSNPISSGSGNYTLASGTLTTNATYVGYNGQGSFTQGRQMLGGTILLTPGGTHTTGALYIGGSPEGTSAIGATGYTLSAGRLIVNGNTWVGYNGNGSLTVGAPIYTSSTGTWTYPAAGETSPISHTTGNLLLGAGSAQSVGGSYSLYTGALDVTGSAYIGYAGTQSAFFNQGGQAEGWSSGPGNSVVSMSTMTNGGRANITGHLYLGGKPTDDVGTGSSGSGNYNLYTGSLIVGGNTYVGYDGGGTFNMGQPIYNATTPETPWMYPATSPESPIAHTTANLYVNGVNPGQPGGGYNLYAGSLTVTGNAYIGYVSGQSGNFNQGKRTEQWSTPPGNQVISTSTLTGGGLATITGNLYIGGKPAAGGAASSGNGNYTLSDGQLLVGGDTYVGYAGQGNFWQGQAPGNGTNEATPGGAYTTANLYLGYTSSGNGSYVLTDGTVTVSGSTYVGYNGQGNFTQGQMRNGGMMNTTNGGVFTTGNLYVGGSTGMSQYTLFNGALNTTNVSVGAGGSGSFMQNGGIHTPGGTITVGAQGNYQLAGGTLTAASIVNNNWFNYSGGQLNGAFENNGRMEINGAGTRTVEGPMTNNGELRANVNGNVTFRELVTNNGSFYVDNSTVIFEKAVTLNGRFVTDPSTLTFQQGLTIGATGVIQASNGDIYEIYGDYTNNSTNTMGWTVSQSTLKFLGAGTHHFLPGSDRNFMWGNVTIGSGVLLELEGNGYVHGLSFESGASLASLAYIDSNGFNLYYDPMRPENAFLARESHLLAGGGYLAPEAAPVPVPAAVWLFAPGLLGLIALRRRMKKG